MSDSSNNSTGSQEAGKRTSGIGVDVFGRTDVGLVRDHNEDNFLIADLTSGNRSIRPEVRQHIVGDRGSLFAVCDGMGGAAAGEVASKIGVDTIYEVLQEGEPPADDYALARRLDEAICEAGTRIFTAAKLNRGQRGMGTTATVAVLIGPRLVIGQVGDSRAHIVRGDELVQITKDQSLVQQLIDAKQLTEEEAKDFDRSYIILQALLPYLIAKSSLYQLVILKLIFYPLFWAFMNIVYEQYHLAMRNEITLKDYTLFNFILIGCLFLMEAALYLTVLGVELGFTKLPEMPINYTIPLKGYNESAQIGPQSPP